MTASDEVSDDGLVRCSWGTAPQDYRRYHDFEWGRPVADDVTVLEKLCLEGFQAGLSWLTILRKRDSFRQAFAGFDVATVAGFGSDDVERLLADAAIIRHRGKIEAAIANARATLAIQEAEGSLAALVWTYEPEPGPAPRTTDELPATSRQSSELSKDLRRRGFRYLGPTTVYAAMQALGLVDDHVADCHARAVVEAERQVFHRPR